MDENIKKPVLFDYLHAATYLHDYFNYRKKVASDFSFEKWSQELGFRSRSYLRMIILQKKRITPTFISSFSEKSLFSPTEKEFFYFLVQYSQAKTSQDRQVFGKKIIQIIQIMTGQKEIENYFEFLSDPFLPKLLTLLSFEDITPTAERFAKIFDCNKDQILKSLTKLKEIGLAETIEVDGELHWRSKNKNFKVSDKFGDIAMKIFHENSFQDAIKSFHKPKDLRRFRSLLLPMDAEEKEELLKMLEQFAAELITRFRSDQYQSRQLFQVNLNFFPVAEPAETASK